MISDAAATEGLTKTITGSTLTLKQSDNSIKSTHHSGDM